MVAARWPAHLGSPTQHSFVTHRERERERSWREPHDCLVKQWPIRSLLERFRWQSSHQESRSLQNHNSVRLCLSLSLAVDSAKQYQHVICLLLFVSFILLWLPSVLRYYTNPLAPVYIIIITTEPSTRTITRPVWYLSTHDSLFLLLVFSFCIMFLVF